MNLIRTELKVMDLIHLAVDRSQWRVIWTW